MRPAPLIVSGGLLLLACSCYGPGYQPYGYPSYPGTVQPGTPYPGGTGGPTLGQPTFNSSQAPIPDNGGSAPRYDGASSNGEQRLVPEYPDATGNDSPYFPSGGSGTSNNSATAPQVEPLSFDQPATSPGAATPSTQPTLGETRPFFPGGDDLDFQRPVQGDLH